MLFFCYSLNSTHIFCKYSLNLKHIFFKYSLNFKHIFWKYSLNSIHIFCKYSLNLTDILCKYSLNLTHIFCKYSLNSTDIFTYFEIHLGQYQSWGPWWSDTLYFKIVTFYSIKCTGCPKKKRSLRRCSTLQSPWFNFFKLVNFPMEIQV